MAIDLIEELTFYKKYHNNPVNVVIHILCIPMILFSFIVFMTYFELPAAISSAIPSILAPVAPFFNAGSLIASVFATYYCFLDVYGVYSVPPIMGLSFAAKYILSNVYTDKKTNMKVLAVVHFTCWILQFIGHGVYEGNAPALLDSLFQSLVLAPYFVILELCFMLGYRKDVEKALNNSVAKALSEKRKQEKQGKEEKQA